MSFIYRDYNKPRIAINNSRILRKSLFEKVHPKTIISGVEVFGTCQIYQDSLKVRADKTFRRFLKNIGTSYKEMNTQILGTENIGKVKNIYFKMDQSKLIFTPKTKADTTNKLNADYLYDMAVPFVNTSSVFYYSQGNLANTKVATLPTNADVAMYKFVVSGGVSEVSEDGNFSITSNGDISITELGFTSTANKVDYTNPFRIDPTYTIQATHLNSTTTNSTITLIVKRDYVDVQITVGGQYANTVSAFAPVASGVPDMMTDLPLLRSTIETNAMHYLAGMYPASSSSTYSNNINLGARRFSMKVADIAFNEDWGWDLDTLAVLDDGTVFECIIPIMSEVVQLTPIDVQYSTTHGTANTQLFNMSYTYTKRYRVKAVATETSVLINNIDIIAQMFKPVTNASIFKRVTIQIANSSNMDTTIKDAVKDLHTDYYYEDNAVFYRGCLRVDAFNAMTAKEFHTVFTKCFTTGFTKKKQKWWKKALAIVIIIIAIVLIVLSFIFPPFGIATASMQAALWALALGMLFLTLAGMVYAKHVGDETGMKMIAGATQVVGITLAIVAICNGYSDAMTAYEAIAAATTTQATVIAVAEFSMAALAVGVGVASLAVNTLDIGGEKERQIVNAAAAVVGAYQGFKSTLAGFSAPAVGPVQNVTNFVNLAASGYKSYLLVNAVGTHTPSATVEEQAVPEDGVESVFLLETRTVAFDAIEALNDRMDIQYGVNATNGILQKQYA